MSLSRRTKRVDPKPILRAKLQKKILNEVKDLTVITRVDLKGFLVAYYEEDRLEGVRSVGCT